ncbi:recombinase family protein [Nocardia cyriacigeorgica]|uniref:Multiple promoter invertase n=1 Tax=Nocardia cyriacigeorgica TaxID=135487 RepID=A0A4U8W5M8_9NOCA|nr:recombinase family protein [Nocardia cyriacigeorgica]VFB01481.1 multiple promoter invertase [Nocardia cyriacigeorgica]
MDTENRRAVIYARASKDRSGVGRSVQQQEAECREWIEEHGWAEGPVFTDNDISASKFSTAERPGYQSLLKALRGGDVLCVWESSRAGRRMEDHLQLRELCANKGVLLCIGGRVYDMTNPDDVHALNQAASTAEYESARMSKRIRRSIKRSAAQGKPHKMLPYGYKKDKETGLWVEDEQAAPIVREVVRRVLAGEGFRGIAKDLNERQVPKPGRGAADVGKPWQGAVLARMVKQASYSGYRTHHGKIVGRGEWPALISEDDRERLLALLEDPDRRMTTRGPEVRHLLTGIAVCGVCGRDVRWRKPKRNTHGHYLCRDSHVARSEPETDAVVVKAMWKAIEEWKADALLWLEVEEDDEGNEIGYAAPKNSAFTEQRRQARELRERLADLERRMINGTIRPEVYERADAELTPRINELEAQARAELVNPIVKALATDTRRLWRGMSLEEKREFVRFTVRVRILPMRRGPFDPSSVEVASALPDHDRTTVAVLRSSALAGGAPVISQ